MTDPGVPHDDMLSFIWRARTDVPEVGDEILDALLTANLTPAQTTAALRPVAEVVAALRSAPRANELTGLDETLAQFRAARGIAFDGEVPVHGRHAPRPRRLRSLALKVGSAVAVAVLGGGVAAAYAGALPAGLQKFAHSSIGAPAAPANPRPHPHPHPHPHQAHHSGAASLPVGPDPAGPAAHGLCTAYANASAHDSGTQRAVAFRNLTAAAGGAGNVAAYCGTVPRPGAGAGARATAGVGAEPRDKPHGKPVSHPSGGTAPKPSHTPPGKQKGKVAMG